MRLVYHTALSKVMLFPYQYGNLYFDESIAVIAMAILAHMMDI